MLPFLAFFVAFAIKVPALPFHNLVPDAHVEAADGRLDHSGRRAAEDGHLGMIASACRSSEACTARLLSRCGNLGIITARWLRWCSRT